MNGQDILDSLSPLKRDCMHRYLSAVKQTNNKRSGFDGNGPRCHDIYKYLFTEEEKNALVDLLVSCLDEE